MEIDIDLIETGRWTQKLRQSDITAQEEAVARHFGILEDVHVKKCSGGRYEVLGTPKPWLLAQLLQLPRVPSKVITQLSEVDLDDYYLRLREGAPAHFFDKAQAMADFVEKRQVSLAEAGRLKGKSRSEICNLLRVLKIDPLLQDEIRRLPYVYFGHAKPLAGLDYRQQRLVFDRIKQDHLTVQQTEKPAREMGTARQIASARKDKSQEKSADTLRLENLLTEHLGTQTEIQEAKNQLVIRYSNLDILQGVLEKIGLTEL